MSILIKGMEMPRNCIECPLQFGGICGAQLPEIDEPLVAETIEEAAKGRTNWCPLVSVPPHGRLIDADALNYTMLYKENWMRGTGVEAPAVWRKDIDPAPTIIPAEESE